MTTMRGMAACLVAAYHLRDGGRDTFLLNGYIWVDFFFVLSGFILGYVYSADFERSVGPSSYKDFLAKRLARIYPLHLFMLFAYVGKVLVFVDRGKADTLQSFLANLFLVQSWRPEDGMSWNKVSWSISSEWAFYLIFPFIVWLVVRRRNLLMPAVVVVAFAGLAAIVYAKGNLNTTTRFGVFRCLCEASMGFVVYQVYRADAAAPVRRFFAHASVQWAALALPFVLMLLRASDLLIVASFVAMMLPLALASGSFKRCFEWAPLHHLGTVSYSLYMCHALILWLLRRLWLKPHGIDPGQDAVSLPVLLAIQVGFLLICVLASTILYRAVEAPGRKLVRRVLGG